MEQLPADTDRTVCQREDTGLLRGKTLPWKILIWDCLKGIKPYGPMVETLCVEWALTPRVHGIHYLVGQPLLSEPSLSADLWSRQRAAQSFWSSGCGSRICAVLLRDTAMPRLDLPPLGAMLAGSPADCIKAWWEPRAHIQARVSGQCNGDFPLRGTTRFGTARYGTARVGLRFHRSLVPL